MAISSAQTTQIEMLVAGLFNATPGAAYLTSFANSVAAGMTIAQLADALAASSAFTSGIMGGKVTAATQVSQLMLNFGLTYGATDAASVAAQAWFTGQVNAGVGFGAMINNAVNFLSLPATLADPTYGAVAKTLANKAAVSDYYSQTLGSGTTASSLTALQAVISGVTATTPVSTPAQLAAAVSASGAVLGTNFTLTTGQDNATATNFFASETYFNVDGKGPTINPGDVLIGTAASGGGVANNSLFIGDLTAGVATNNIPSGVTISNIQNIVLNSSGNTAASGFNSNTIAGVLTLNVTTAGNAGDVVRGSNGVAATPGTAVNAGTAITATHNSTIGGGVTVLGGTTVTVYDNTNNAGVVLVGLTVAGTVPLPANVATGAINVTTSATGAGGNVDVVGGTTVNVIATSTAYTSNINIGNTAVNTGNSNTTAANIANTANPITVNDAGAGGTVTVFGGTTVNVTAGGGAVVVGDNTVNLGSNMATGAITVNDTNPTPYDNLPTGNVGAQAVSVYGGTNVNVTTNTGSVAIGINNPNVNTLPAEPTGAITVVDTANDAAAGGSANAAVAVYGGTTVNVTAADANVTVGTPAGGAAGTAPSGAVTVTESRTSTQQDIAAASVAAIAIDGGNGVTVTAKGQNVSVGNTLGTTAGAQVVTQNGILTGAGFGRGNGTVLVDGGTTVAVTTTGGNVTVGQVIGAINAVPSGAVTIADNFGAGNAMNDAIAVQGGTTVGITLAGADKGNITVGAAATLNAGGTAVNNGALDASGNVTIANSQTNGTTKTFGTGAVNVYTNGAATVSITGGATAKVIDVQSTLATGGANAGKAVGTSALATVNLDGVTTGGAVAIQSDVLANLSILDNNVAGNAYTVTDNTAAHALTLTLGNESNVYNGNGTAVVTNANMTVTDAKAGTVTVTDNAQASTATVALAVAAATALTVNNAAGLKLDLTGDTALNSITLKGAGNVTLTNAALGGSAAFAIDATASTGSVTANVTTAATTAGVLQTFKGGSGTDTITIASNPSGWGTGISLLGGTGTSDVLVANYAAAAAGDLQLGNTASIKGFEILGLGAAASSAAGANANYDASGFSGVTMGAVAAAVNITNAASGAFLTMTALPGFNVGFSGAVTTGTADALTVNVGVAGALGSTSAAATGTTGLNTAAATVVTANGYENLTVNSLGQAGSSGTNTVSLADVGTAGAGTLTIGGTMSLTATDANTGFTAINASTNTGKTVDVTAVTPSNVGTTFTGGSAALKAAGAVGGTEKVLVTLGRTGIAAPFLIADTAVVNVGGAIYTYTVAGANASAATAATAFAAAITAGATTGQVVKTGGANPAGLVVTASSGNLVMTVPVAAGAAPQPVTFYTSSVAGTMSGGLVGGLEEQVVTVVGNATATANTTVAVVNGLNVVVASTIGDTPTVTAGLVAAAINAVANNPAALDAHDGVVSAVASGAKVIITGGTGTTGVFIPALASGASNGVTTTVAIPANVAANTTLNYASVTENLVAGAGGTTYAVGVGGSWDANLHKYSSGSETVNLTASTAATDTLSLVDGRVATFNGSTGGVTGYKTGVQADVDQLTFTTGAKTIVANAVLTTVSTVTGAATMATVLDPSGALFTAMGNLTYLISNGVITFGAVGGHSLSEFTTAQLISAAEIIVNSATGGNGANKVAAFSNGTDSFVIASDAGALLAAGLDAKDALVQLKGVTSVSGFGSTFGQGTVVATNVTQLSNANMVATASATQDDTGFSLQTINGVGAGTTTTETINNLAASSTITTTATGTSNITTTQLGTAALNSLTVNLSGAETVNVLNVSGDALLVLNPTAATTITSVIDGGATSTLNTIQVLAGGATLDIAAVTDTALTTINVNAATAVVTIGDGNALSQNALTLTDTPTAPNATAVQVGKWVGAVGTLGFSGNNDVINIGTAAANNTGNNKIVDSGASAKITIDGNGANSVTANGAGDTITVGDSANGSGINTIIANGSGDSVTFLGTQAGAAIATVGTNATVTFGTVTAGGVNTETVNIAGDLTGAVSTGTYNFTTLNNFKAVADAHITLNNVTGTETFAGGGTAANALVNVSTATTLAQALDLAVSQSAISVQPNPTLANFAKIGANNGVADWFQFAGNTYIVEANNPTAAAAAHATLTANDAVVKIVGLVDLSTLNFGVAHTIYGA